MTDSRTKYVSLQTTNGKGEIKAELIIIIIIILIILLIIIIINIIFIIIIIRNRERYLHEPNIRIYSNTILAIQFIYYVL
jgi:heme/copper-type cytochrome/quinol oxidase subunit 2